MVLELIDQVKGMKLILGVFIANTHHKFVNKLADFDLFFHQKFLISLEESCFA
jgi:hypothetical protein